MDNPRSSCRTSGRCSPVDSRRVAIAAVLFYILVVHLTACGSGSSGHSPEKPIPAFPEAEGFGQFAKGGRGGRVIEVTNLTSSGSGSFRQCAEIESGPRTCVFRVSGTIGLETADIVVRHPFLTIAGQTAPGGGVALKDGGLDIRADHTIIRYLRVRPGARSWIELGTNANGIVYRSTESGAATHDHICDHCSVSWGTDDLIAVVNGTYNVTIQDSLLSEGLADGPNCNNCGSRGLLIGTTNKETVSVLRTLSAHNFIRFPNASGGQIDFVNNVDYNGNGSSAQIVPANGPVHINLIANWMQDGADLVPANSQFPAIRLVGGFPFSATSRVYVFGNLGRGRPVDSAPQEFILWNDNGGVPLQDTRFDYPAVTMSDANQARDLVLSNAGAILPMRDAVDRRVVEDVRRTTGRIISDPAAVGGWPSLVSGVAPTDSDHDGMPDAWELTHGLDPANPNDGPQDFDGDGYTNLEEFLNSTDPRSAQSQ